MPEISLKSDLSNKTYKISEVPCDKRVKLYKDLLADALIHLESIARDDAYEVNSVIDGGDYLNRMNFLNRKRLKKLKQKGINTINYHILWIALDEQHIIGLIKSLIKILDPWVMAAVSFDITGQPLKNIREFGSCEPIKSGSGMNTPNAISYNDYIKDITQNSDKITAFYEKHVWTNNIITKLKDNFVNNIKLSCERVKQDWLQIREVFFPEYILLELTEIRSTGSDFHKGGKQVIILKFNIQRIPEKIEASGFFNRVKYDPRIFTKKLVYKPSDVEIDCLLSGDTAAFAKDVGYKVPGENKSVIEILNSELITQKWEKEGTPFPAYKILPRITRDVNNAYGYIEFLTFSPEMEPGTQFSAVKDFVKKYPNSYLKRTDYILNPRELENYYIQLGRLFALAFMFGISDMHWQNRINHKKMMHLIDLEDSLKWPFESIGETGLGVGMYSKSFNSINELRVVNNKIESTRVSEIVMSQIYVDVTGKHKAVRIMQEDDFKKYYKSLCKGFVQAMLIFKKSAQKFTDWIDAVLPGAYTRFVPVATATYYTRQFAFLVGQELYNGEKEHKIKKVKENIIINARKDWVHANLEDKGELRRDWLSHPHFLLSTNENDFADYNNGDIPSYYRRTDETNLYNGIGQKVDLKSADSEQEHFGYDNVEYVNIEISDLEVKNAANDSVEAAAINATKAYAAITNNRYFPKTQIQLLKDNFARLTKTEGDFNTIVCQNLANSSFLSGNYYIKELDVSFEIDGKTYHKASKSDNWTVT